MEDTKNIDYVMAKLLEQRELLSKELDEVNRALDGIEIANKRINKKSSKRGRRAIILDHIREIVQKIEFNFTIRDVLELFKQRYPDLVDKNTLKRISSALVRMAIDKEVDVEEPGSGKRPTRYCFPRISPITKK